MSEAAQGVITDIRIADSDQAALGIGLDWGTVGPLHMADEKQKEMRALFNQGKLYGTHPHDILIKKIRIGRLTRNENDDDSAAIRTSGCYNITIDDVEIMDAGVGVALHELPPFSNHGAQKISKTFWACYGSFFHGFLRR